MWKLTQISTKDLAAINTAHDSEISIPSTDFGDPETDLLKFRIPKFQRGLRWSADRRKKFLKSLREGQPTGVIVFARTDDEEKNKKVVKCWFVLDGQQRIAALSLLIAEFWENHLYELDVHQMDQLKDALSIDASHTPSLELALKKLCSPEKGKPVFQPSIFDNQNKFLSKWCVASGVEYPSHDEEKEETALELARKIGKDLREQHEGLKNYPIPALLIRIPQGADERKLLAVLFENLNNNVPLKKTELLAAHWEHYLISWEPTLFKRQPEYLEKLMSIMSDRIINTYNSDDGENKYEPDVEKISEDNVSFYDFFYALGVASRLDTNLEKREVFCQGGDGKKSIEDLGFNTFRLFITHTLGSSKPTIEEHFKTPNDPFEIAVDGKAEVGRCIDAFNACLSTINSELNDLSNFNKMSRNTRTIGATAAPAYIANLLSLRFTRQLSQRTGDLPFNNSLCSIKSLEKQWKSHLKAWWLRDILSKDFVGSNAYSNAAERVKHETGSMEPSPNTSMCKPPPLNELFHLFTQVFYDEHQHNSGVTPKRRRSSDQAKAIMHLICSNYPEGKPVELDHLIPWKQRDGVWPVLKDSLPLNHLANLMPISSTLNKDRGNVPWSEYFQKIESKKERNFIEDNLLLPVNEFTDEVRGNSELFCQFLIRRWALIVDRSLSEIIENELWHNLPREDRCERLMNYVTNPILDLLEIKDPTDYQIESKLLD
jgi:hypothetical protein